MKIIDAVKNRRSIRKFQRKSIPEDIIRDLKNALIWAPSAGNLQARKFIFVFSHDVKSRLVAHALRQSFIADAPLTIVACTDSRIKEKYGERGVNLYTIQDVSASIMGMMLVAHEAGLGSVWIGAFDEAKVSDALNLPHNLTPVAIVPVGYPAESPSAPPRVSIQDAIEEV
ncbi:MAG: nitroreductase family protein [Nitrospirae bacterium]|nr:nitroreductase family protein [Nitrospirota bacterium]